MASQLCGEKDVYYGVGLQRNEPADGGRGRADSVEAIPGLWMDIDIKGPNHKEQTVYFKRSKGMKSLPRPEYGVNLDELKEKRETLYNETKTKEQKGKKTVLIVQRGLTS